MTSNAYGLRLLSQPRVRIAVLVLVAVLVLAFRAVQFAALTTQIQWGYDFSAYWTAGARLLQGDSIYTTAQLAGSYAPQQQFLYLYPPPLAALAAPLAALFPTDYRAAAWVWFAIGAAVLAASVLALHRSERLGERFPVLGGRGRWLLVAAAFSFPPVVGELVLGNVHLLLLGLLTLAWLAIRRATPSGELIAGLAVGVAAVIKVFPGLLLPWLLLTRRYRAAAGMLIGAAIVTLVTLPFTGFEPWTQFPTVLANLSPPLDTHDTLAPTVWLAPALGFAVARILVTMVGFAIVVWVARIPTMHIADGDDRDATSTTVRSFAATVTVAVLIAPALYHHYLALLVLPLVLGLGAGVPLRYLAAAYFLMWGGDQPALGGLAWLVNRAMPTLGALVLLLGLGLTPIRPAIKADRSAIPVRD